MICCHQCNGEDIIVIKLNRNEHFDSKFATRLSQVTRWHISSLNKYIDYAACLDTMHIITPNFIRATLFLKEMQYIDRYGIRAVASIPPPSSSPPPPPPPDRPIDILTHVHMRTKVFLTKRRYAGYISSWYNNLKLSTTLFSNCIYI